MNVKCTGEQGSQARFIQYFPGSSGECRVRSALAREVEAETAALELKGSSSEISLKPCGRRGCGSSFFSLCLFHGCPGSALPHDLPSLPGLGLRRTEPYTQVCIWPFLEQFFFPPKVFHSLYNSLHQDKKILPYSLSAYFILKHVQKQREPRSDASYNHHSD